MPNKRAPIGRPAPYSFAWQPKDNAPNEFRFASGNECLSEVRAPYQAEIHMKR